MLKKITEYKFNAMEKYAIARLHIVKMSIIPNDLYTKNPRSF